MRRSTILLLVTLSFGVLLPAACTQNFGVFATTGAGGSSSASSSTSSSASSSSGAGGCKIDADCGDSNPCTADSCDKATGKCSNTPVPDGPLMGPPPVQGNCMTQGCSMGTETMVPDDTNVPTNTQCTTFTCSMGTIMPSNMPATASCGTAPDHCDGMGNCIGCMQDSDCPMVNDCQKRHCTMAMVCTPSNDAPEATCTSAGGRVCDGNGNCVPCVMDGDCPNGPPDICVGSACQSSCGDSMTDGTETDQDCGGACPGCAVGKMCHVGGDCVSGFCTGNSCALAPDGHACAGAGQCASGNCVAGICCNTACGGTCMACTAALTGAAMDGTCGPILAGKNAPMGQCNVMMPCGNDGKCDGSGNCEMASSTTTCAAATCANGTATPARKCDGTGTCSAASPMMCGAYACNGGGTACDTTCNVDTDCASGNYCTMANACVAQLANGTTCAASDQCLDGLCNASMVCATATCTDTSQDGNETDVDCGGTGFMGAAACPKCANGKMCLVGTDCTSGDCYVTGGGAGQATCHSDLCSDGIKDGAETDIDCGGGTCSTCVNGKHCLMGSDCMSGNCNNGQHRCQ